MITCNAQNASLFAKWISDRGGVATWDSINLSNPGASWSTPALMRDGRPMTKPSWQCGDAPSKITTDASEVSVITPKEVKRFHVGIRMGSNGMSMKVTDGGTRKIRAAVAKAGEDAWYEFDYETQDVVIYVPGETVPLAEFMNRKV